MYFNMTITSFSFIFLITIGVIIYYILPKSWQWIELLIFSLVFYCCASTPYTIVYLIISTLLAYIATLWMEKEKEKGQSKLAIAILAIVIIVNICLWFLLKGKGLWSFFLWKIQNYICIPQIADLLNMQLIAPLGMGYYTLQVLGYIIDCYWGNVKPQKNLLKLFLFVVYFPQLTTGPISRYDQISTLYGRHTFSYKNISYGTQRILWGFVKKLVLAERIGVIVTAIINNTERYNGFYSWIAILLYPLQMYADFSGCMDIVLGVSELFDIHLAENFNNPFLARTSQEFWQRWHITLGTWAKDYVLYPLLKSKVMIRFGKVARKKIGKKMGKFVANAVGMFVLWMVMGIWHGGLRYIVGVSLWYWTILMIGELLTPIFGKVTSAFNIKTESFSWHLFQSARTYLIYAIGATFFSLGVGKGMLLLKDACRVLIDKDYANPWIFFDESILTLGITFGDINIIMMMVVLLLIVAYLREKHGYARIWVQNQNLLFRWGIWIGLFVLIIIYGKYGPGYSASEFIYQGF